MLLLIGISKWIDELCRKCAVDRLSHSLAQLAGHPRRTAAAAMSTRERIYFIPFPRHCECEPLAGVSANKRAPNGRDNGSVQIKKHFSFIFE